MCGVATGGHISRRPHAWAVGSKCSLTRSIKTSRSGSGQPPLIISATLRHALNSPPHCKPPKVSPQQVVPACFADGDTDPGDRNYLVLAKPNVIMNDIRLRGLDVASSDAAGWKSGHNHAETARNLRRSLRKCDR